MIAIKCRQQSTKVSKACDEMAMNLTVMLFANDSDEQN